MVASSVWPEHESYDGPWLQPAVKPEDCGVRSLPVCMPVLRAASMASASSKISVHASLVLNQA